MISRLGKAIGLGAALLMSAGLTNAATLTDGGVLCEGPELLLPADCFNPNPPRIGDGPEGGTGPTVNIAFSGSGTGHIFGGVRGNQTTFTDNFTLDGTGAYKLTLTALNFRFQPAASGTPEFDATWFMGGFNVGVIGNLSGNASELSFTIDLTGGELFSLVAAGGDGTDGSIMEYKLEVTAVPLPAGAVLLLSGLGGIVAMRRRKKAA